MKNKTVMIVAGEASGDIYGAQLVKAMAKKSNDINFCGVGSSAMESAGVNILINAAELSVMGITEVVSKIPFIVHSMKHVKNAMKRIMPKLVILIDFPDFNFYVAAVAKKLKIPVLYYVSPQLWAWRKGRVKKIKKLVDRVAVILPFEESFYKRHNIPATFVGHPLLDNIQSFQKMIKDDISNTSKYPIVGLLPGSRNKEITRLLPIMLESAKLIRENIPTAKFIVSHAKSVDTKKFNKIIAKHRGSMNIEVDHKPLRNILNKFSCLIAASGTVTLEAALHGIPMVIVYKVSGLSFLIGKILVDVEHIGLVNLILKKRLVPELIQDEVSCKNISRLMINLLKNKKTTSKIRAELLNVKKRLGTPGASKRVASMAIDMLTSNRNENSRF